MKRYFTHSVIFIILVMFSISGCSKLGLKPQMDHKNPHIRGVISDLTLRENNTGYMVVKGVKETDTQYSIASIGLNSKTKIFIKDENGTHKSDLHDLANGETVEVLFSGPIAQSYPVQATAREIIIIKGGD